MTEAPRTTDWQKAEPHHRLRVEGGVGTLAFDVAADFHAPWTVLFGPSGCGKSTLLRAMCGLIHHLKVSFARRDQAGTWNTIEDRARREAPEHRSLAYAPQQAVLFPHLSVEQNVGFASVVTQSSATDLVPETLAFFALEPLAQKMPRTLSGGERQRVSLARAFAVPHPRLMLLDEPFTGLDRSLRDDLLPRMRSWAYRRGIPVISVTHDVDEVYLLAADVIRLRQGRIVAQGAPKEVLGDEADRILRTLSNTGAAKEAYE